MFRRNPETGGVPANAHRADIVVSSPNPKGAESINTQRTDVVASSLTSQGTEPRTRRPRRWKTGLVAGLAAGSLFAPAALATMGNTDSGPATAAKDTGKGLGYGAREVGAIVANTVCYAKTGLDNIHQLIFDARNFEPFKNCVGYVGSFGNSEQTLKEGPGAALPYGVTHDSFKSGSEIDFGSGPGTVTFDSMGNETFNGVSEAAWKGDGVVFPVGKNGIGTFINAADQAVVFNINAGTIDVTKANVPHYTGKKK